MKVKTATIVFVYVLIQAIQCGSSSSYDSASYNLSERHRVSVQRTPNRSLPIINVNIELGTPSPSAPTFHDTIITTTPNTIQNQNKSRINRRKHKPRPVVHKRRIRVYTVDGRRSTPLGIYLAHHLTRIGVRQYTYKHNTEFKNVTFRGSIVACDRNFQTFCPANTMVICAKSGGVRCVANITSTVPCSTNNETLCVNSSVPCKDNDSMLCQQSPGRDESIAIPCLSTMTIKEYIGYVNNTIVARPSPLDSMDSYELLNNSEYMEALLEGVGIPKPVHKFCEAIQLERY